MKRYIKGSKSENAPIMFTTDDVKELLMQIPELNGRDIEVTTTEEGYALFTIGDNLYKFS